MSDNRRDAWRIPHAGTGWLAADGFRAACVVEDISVTGARVRLSRVRGGRQRQLPQELTLTAMVGGEQVTVPGTLTRFERGDDGLRLGIHFRDGDAAGLGWLINQAQREEIAARQMASCTPDPNPPDPGPAEPKQATPAKPLDRAGEHRRGA